MIALILLGLSACIYSINSYQITKPARFYVDPKNLGKVATASAQFLLRLGSGAFVQNYNVAIVSETSENLKDYSIFSGIGLKIAEKPLKEFVARPKELIELYEFDGCPFCRKVREAVTLLDLDVHFFPCPKGGPTYREKVMAVGGKYQFPYLVDPNTGVSMYESADIIQYLFDTYGTGDPVPDNLNNGFLSTLTASLAMVPRAGKGSKFEESKPAKLPLVYYGYESSPFCKIVRERMVELELQHIQKTCGRGSSKRQELLDKTGIFQVPYIEDPNTGVNLFESADILNYLNSEYAVGAQ